MEAGAQLYGPEPAESLSVAASQARTAQDLAGLLRDLRRRHARSRRDSTLTYRELAAKTGWSQTAIAEYFTARTLPPTDRFDALLEVLGAVPAERRALANARDRIEEANRRTRGRRSPDAAPEEPLEPGAPMPSPVPRQLPAAPRLFTGRTRELGQLDDALDEQALDEQGRGGGTLVISAIGGTGGIGKTWLALHWAHQNLDCFPDGQLYANLRGYDPSGDPLAATVVMRGFLEALGVPPGALPAEAEAQAGLYRGLLAGKRTLILLDNARDTAHVTPLLPGGSTCTVLITSRRQLTGLVATHGARPVALDTLPEHEARQLLGGHLGRSRIEAEPDAVGTLLDYCAGLPLALSIAAARAITHPHASLDALTSELRHHSHRLDAFDAGEPQADLRAVLSWSSQGLSADATRALGLLAIAPGPDIALPAAASLLTLPTATTRSLLRELQDAHLVQPHASGRYRMHDLLRLYAAEQAEGGDQAALRGLVDFYVHTAYIGGRTLAPQRPESLLGEPAPGPALHPPADPAAMMAWFDDERACLLAAQRLAHTRGWDAEVCRLAWSLEPYYRRRGILEEQAAAWALAVEAAERLGNPAVRIQAHQLLADAYAQLGRTTDALTHLGRALTFAEENRDMTSQGDIHHSLGGAWERHGDMQKALEHAQQALGIVRRLGDSYYQARALNGVGWLQALLGQYAEARANCEEALTLLREHPTNAHQIGESHTLDSLAFVACRLGDYDQALDYYDQALKICRAQGHSFFEPRLLEYTGEALKSKGRPHQARESWTQALALYTAQHRPTDAARVRTHLDALVSEDPGGRNDPNDSDALTEPG
ncbi:MAG TPA: tetratricopeptide repeat protein [Actinocrinis sp.]|nr:tetratricopeptide repeat protein [Actinocrinis sp.]